MSKNSQGKSSKGPRTPGHTFDRMSRKQLKFMVKIDLPLAEGDPHKDRFPPANSLLSVQEWGSEIGLIVETGRSVSYKQIDDFVKSGHLVPVS